MPVIQLILPYLKKFWWILIVFGVAIYYNIKISNLETLFEQNLKSHQNEISIIEDANKKLIEENALSIEFYQNQTRQIEENYLIQFKELQKTKNNQIAGIEKEFAAKQFESLH